MTDLLQRIEAQIQKRGLLRRGQTILVAVSGGLDSMVLLHALKELSARQGWKITVAHFNHRLRGRTSDADEHLVCKTAAAMQLPVVVERGDVKAFAAEAKISIEMAARKLRHAFFSGTASGRKIKTIALAHHADDQIELFFLRLLRGAGGEGLAGMKWIAPSPADHRLTLVRPLLDLNKKELLAFAREAKVRFRDDETNFSSDFLRNRIRNELLPLLRKDYQPGLDRTVLRLMEITGAEAEFVGNAASSQRLDSVRPQAERYTFAGLPVAIQRRVLQSQLTELGVAVDFDLVEQLRETAGKFISVSSGLTVSRDAGGKLSLHEQQPAEFNADEVEVKLSGRAGDVNFNGVKVNWSFSNGLQGRSSHQIGREFFDADTIGRKITLRHWRAGDRFQPIGLKSAAKLQDLFTNAKIPHGRRRRLIVAEVADGEIFWVEGLRISENFKLTPRTKRRLVWNWRRIEC